jgi:polysaccharide biosynthesis/export protein
MIRTSAIGARLSGAAFVCALCVGHQATLTAQSSPADSGPALAAYDSGTAPTPAIAKSDATPAAIPGIQQRNPRYRLRKGDSFDVDFTFSPEFNQTLSVQPDGFVTLKEVGSIYVEGQTVPELTQTLKDAYAKILHEPVIAVALKDFEKPYFIAAGQVAKPGKYDLRGPLTVTEAVAIAGGFNDSAKHSQVVLFHPTPNGVFEAKLLNVKQLLASRNLSEDIYLQPGDMLYVPQSMISKIRKYIPNSSVGAYYNPAVN